MITKLQEAKKQLNEILSRPEFAGIRRQAEPIDQQSLPTFQMPSEWIWGIYLFFGVVIVALLIGWGIVWWRKRQQEREGDSLEQLGRSWISEAQSYAARGQYRLAARSLFQYLLVRSASQKWIYPHPAKTNGEYRQEVQRNEPVHARPFTEIAQQFDETWYGEEGISAAGYEQYQRKIAQLAEMEGRNES